MPKITVDSEDLLTLIQKCKNNELKVKAYVALASESSRNASETSNDPERLKLPFKFAAAHKATMEKLEEQVSLRYIPAEKAIAQGIEPAAALKNLVDHL